MFVGRGGGLVLALRRREGGRSRAPRGRGDGTGLIFGINDESLGFILLTVPVLIFGLYYVANTTDASIMAGGKDDDSGLTL